MEEFRCTEDPYWRQLDPAAVAPATRAAVDAAVRQGTPLRFLLPAFPAKSANRKKTTGDLPDLGDVTALFRLDELCRQAEAIHAPGTEVVLCSDGRVSADVVGVSDSAVSAYRDGISQAMARYDLKTLKLYCLEDAYSAGTPADLRETLVSQFAVTTDALAQEIANSDARRAMFNGIHRFLFEDAVAIPSAVSRAAAREATKPSAYETVRRSDAWSRLVAAKFPDSVRLSIHPQLEGAEKIPVRLLPSDERWATRWHRSVAWDGTRVTLQRREKLEAAGAQLATTSDGWNYWQTDSELVSQAVTMLVAGQVTTTDQLCNNFHTLLEEPERWAALAKHPERIPVAIEECNRLDPAVTFLFRIVKETVTVGDATFAAGDVVFVSNHCVNRDASTYGAPETFRPDRAKNPRMAYDHGAHCCLGAKLARDAMVACFRAIAVRFPKLQLAEGAVARKHPSLAFSGLDRLAVKATTMLSPVLGDSLPAMTEVSPDERDTPRGMV